MQSRYISVNSRWIWLLVKPLLYRNQMASAPNRSTSQITHLKVVWKTSVIEKVFLVVSKKQTSHYRPNKLFMGVGSPWTCQISKGVNTGWMSKLWEWTENGQSHGTAHFLYKIKKSGQSYGTAHFQKVSTQAEWASYGETKMSSPMGLLLFYIKNWAVPRDCSFFI